MFNNPFKFIFFNHKDIIQLEWVDEVHHLQIDKNLLTTEGFIEGYLNFQSKTLINFKVLIKVVALFSVIKLNVKKT
jgi:hypothetical protein